MAALDTLTYSPSSTMADFRTPASQLVAESRSGGLAGAGRVAIDWHATGLPDDTVRAALGEAVPALAHTSATDVARRRAAGAAPAEPGAILPPDAVGWKVVQATAFDAQTAGEARTLAHAFSGALGAVDTGYGALTLGIERSLARLIDAQVRLGQPIGEALAEQTGLFPAASPREQVEVLHRVMQRLIKSPDEDQYPSMTRQQRTLLSVALAAHQREPAADIRVVVAQSAKLFPLIEQRGAAAAEYAAEPLAPTAARRVQDATESTAPAAPTVDRTTGTRGGETL